MFSFEGHCPVCDLPATFTSSDEWFRDHLLCVNCGSIPRERAVAWAISNFVAVDIPLAVVHELAPAGRTFSTTLSEMSGTYFASQYFADTPRGEQRDGVRSENIEALTLEDSSVDLHVHLDVLEHVNRPDRGVQDLYRTLRPGGATVFTTPVHAELKKTRRRAIIFDDSVEHVLPADYHGNPISEDGALVTFDFGNDIADLIWAWEPRFSTTRIQPLIAKFGILGKFTDVFILERPA